MDLERTTQHLQEAIRFPTVSDFDHAKEDELAFAGFIGWLEETYPHIYAAADFKRVGRRGLLYRISAGEAGEAACGSSHGVEPDDPAKRSASTRLGGPAALMAHYDVVPVEPEKWEEAPFSGVIRDGCLWGRGSLDTKGTLICAMEAVEDYLKAGRRPVNDLYLAFSGEEETEGTSAEEIVDVLEEAGIRPAFVLDEGGAVIPEGLPGVQKTSAMIGIAEKGVANVKVTLKGPGGHASTPPRHTLLGRMAAAACAIEKHKFRGRITEPVAGMFDLIGRERGGAVGLAFRNVRALKPAVIAAATYLGGTFRAMVRSSAAVTMMSGSPSYNVLPGEVSMGLNLRLLLGDTIESAVDELSRVVDDPAMVFEVISGSDPSPVSRADGPAWELLTETVKEVWPEVLVAPYTLNGGTDSRSWHRISDHVYKFTPMVMKKDERGSVHGHNEKIRLEALGEMASFYEKLVGHLFE